MISAREALALPKAALSDSDRQATEAIVADLDAHVRANMTHAGCALQIDARRLNNVIINEVGNRLRQAGWMLSLNEVRTTSALTGQPMISGFHFFLRPLDEVYDGLARDVRANGASVAPLFAGA